MGRQSANLRLACRSYAGPAHFYCTLKRLPFGARPTVIGVASDGDRWNRPKGPIQLKAQSSRPHPIARHSASPAPQAIELS